jgi:hypothetical protein
LLAEVVARELDPVGLVEDRIELDEGHAQRFGQLPAHRRLAGA